MRRFILTLSLLGILTTTASVLAQEATEEAPPVTVEAAVPASAIAPDALPVLISARTDLELLASNQLGAQRPIGWSGSVDINNANMMLLLRLDLELLAGMLYSLEARPPGWFGAVPGTPFSIARDIRHDLELLADTVVALNVRPPGWAGDAPLMRCDRATQTLVELLDGSGFILTANPLSPDYCQQAALQASQYTDLNLTAAPITAIVETGSPAPSSPQIALPPGTPIRANGSVTLAFLNRYATKRVGIIPESEPFVPVARSYTQFSHMTLVRGNQFEVFVDYKTTTLTDEQFEALPNVNDFDPQPVCEADWCHEPITITSPTTERGRQRTQVNAGTNIVIYFDGGDANGMTLVRMELCPQPTTTSRVGCQPVTSVIRDGVAVASTGQTINGIPQYRLPVRYSTTSARSRDFFTTELWIAPPEDR